MKKWLLIAGSALASTVATAADLPSRAAASAPAPLFVQGSWSGFYVGAFAGFNRSRTVATDISGEEYGGGTPGARMSLTDQGFSGGLTLGYNFQRGAFVFGPELELGYTTNDRTRVINGDDGLLSRSRGLYGFGGVRLGYLVSANTLLFAKGGAVLGRVRNAGGEFDGVGNEDDSGFWGFDGNETAGGTRTRLGFGIGAGIEHRLNMNWSFKVEYMYKNLGSSTYQTLVSDVQPFRFTNESHTVKLGINYHFSGSTAPVVAKY